MYFAKMDSALSPRLDVSLGVVGPWRDSHASATEREDGEEFGFDAHDGLVGGDRAVGWPGCTIEDVHGVLEGVGPEADRCSAGYQVSAHVLGEGTYGTFCHAVELVDVRRTGGGLDQLVVQVLGELSRGVELTGVVGVKGTHYLDLLGLVSIGQGVDGGDELACGSEGIALLAQHECPLVS